MTPFQQYREISTGTDKHLIIGSSILEGTYVISVVCESVCESVCNADISGTIIAMAAKFCMLILHIKSANSVEGIFKICLRSRGIEI